MGDIVDKLFREGYDSGRVFVNGCCDRVLVVGGDANNGGKILVNPLPDISDGVFLPLHLS